MFKLALVQMRVDGGQRARNLERTATRVAEAAAVGAQVVLLPEVMDLGWTDPSNLSEAEPIPTGSASRRLAELARGYGLYLCAGLAERDGDAVYNAAVLIDPNGEVVLKHRKLNELGIGHAAYAQGDRLGVHRTPFGTLGLMICADGFARDQVVTRALGYMGADVILSPSAWAVDADHDNLAQPYGGFWRRVYRAPAQDFQMWIASVSNVGWVTGGPWQGRKCIGCSLVIDPTGREALVGPYGVDAEAVLFIDVEPRRRPARGAEWADYWEGK